MTTTHFEPEEVMAWVDGELPAGEAQTVATHVEECAECAGVAAGFRKMSEELAEWRVEESPGRVEAAVMGAADAAKEHSHGRLRRTGVARWWGLGVGGALVAAAVVLVVASPRSREHTSMPMVAPQSRQFDGLELESKLQPSPNAPAQELDAKVSQFQDRAIAADKAAAPLAEQGMRSEVEKLQTRAAQAQLSENLKDVGTAGRGGSPLAATAAPMIARAVSLTVRVQDVEAGRAAVEAVLVRHHGYAAQMNASTAEGAARSFTASLRIPAPELAAALKELRGLGRVENESQSGEEVTQQHEDLVARLKNARETEARLQAILEQRTGRISDVLEVEQEIARVRGEIESMEAEQAGLEHRVDFASVELTLVEQYKAQFTAPDSVGTRVRNAFVEGYRNAWDTVLGMVLFCEEAGPTLVVWGIVLALPVGLVWRRYRRFVRAL